MRIPRGSVAVDFGGDNKRREQLKGMSREQLIALVQTLDIQIKLLSSNELQKLIDSLEEKVGVQGRQIENMESTIEAQGADIEAALDYVDHVKSTTAYRVSRAWTTYWEKVKSVREGR